MEALLRGFLLLFGVCFLPHWLCFACSLPASSSHFPFPSCSSVPAVPPSLPTCPALPCRGGCCSGAAAPPGFPLSVPVRRRVSGAPAGWFPEAGAPRGGGTREGTETDHHPLSLSPAAHRHCLQGRAWATAGAGCSLPALQPKTIPACPPSPLRSWNHLFLPSHHPFGGRPPGMRSPFHWLWSLLFLKAGWCWPGSPCAYPVPLSSVVVRFLAFGFHFPPSLH